MVGASRGFHRTRHLLSSNLSGGSGRCRGKISSRLQRRWLPSSEESVCGDCRPGEPLTPWRSMQIMCGGLTRRSSGRARRMATELRPEHEGSIIRMLRSDDAAALAEILHRSPEAVFWPETSVREVLEWKGILGLAGE